jgi:Uncharacterized conserved protein
MTWDGKLVKVDNCRWEIPKGHIDGMFTNGIVYADDSTIAQTKEDNALQQVANVACLPGIVGSSMAMPDIHWGYGFPIGGVAAVDGNSGSISPGGIGFDINCGVRLVRTDLTEEDVSPVIGRLVDELYKEVPSGLGSKGSLRMNQKELSDVLNYGSKWAVENGYGWENDLQATEELGHMEEASDELVSDKARKRGIPQLGSLGSGNHFLEVDVVDEVFDESVAKRFGLQKGTVTVTVHCGSRGCGHQIATDHLQIMEKYVRDHRISIPDRQLACAPLDSKEGETYFKAMSCGANYAWANRQMITHWIRGSFEKVMEDSAENMGMDVVYDVSHNIAKKERHQVDGKSMDVLVHRKGATRAFPSGRSELPMMYRDVGQPVIIPGDMSAGTYVLVGKQGALKDSFGSTCHGAGRRMSRKGAAHNLQASDVREEMRSHKIYLRCGSDEGLLEEAPQAYKDVSQVVEVVCNAGLTDKVVKLRPIGVVKG